MVNIDTQLFRLINNAHCIATDWLMWVVSQHWFWVAILVVVFGILMIRNDGKQWWIALMGVALCFLLADRGSVVLFKDTVCRLRPCHVLEDVNMFRTSCGGRYGFVSSHAANALALMTFALLRYRPLRKGQDVMSRTVSVALMVWVALCCYSRVYLGKHYPGDVLCGAMYGAIVGAVVVWLTALFEKKSIKK
ncbi:MAG: phosphatase PAP2 family protein [Bacteroidales bacterium]|nr:phosphatase PAP2 family protein [Bacteroidales bacterium]